MPGVATTLIAISALQFFTHSSDTLNNASLKYVQCECYVGFSTLMPCTRSDYLRTWRGRIIPGLPVCFFIAFHMFLVYFVLLLHSFMQFRRPSTTFHHFNWNKHPCTVLNFFKNNHPCILLSVKERTLNNVRNAFWLDHFLSASFISYVSIEQPTCNSRGDPPVSHELSSPA